MRKTINLLGWIAVSFTILALILTLLTSYQFTYIKYFDSYYTLQWSIFFTMVIWSIKMFDCNGKHKSITYPIVCLAIAVCTMCFIILKVY